MMMIQVDLPFAAKLVEPPVATDTPTFPKPVLFLGLAAAGSFLLAIFLVFVIDALRAGKLRHLPTSAH